MSLKCKCGNEIDYEIENDTIMWYCYDCEKHIRPTVDIIEDIENE